jgi:hypothetical protein
MRLRKLDADQRIAKGVELIHAPMGFRKYFELVLQAFLVRRGTRHQVQQVMRMHHVRGVF